LSVFGRNGWLLRGEHNRVERAAQECSASERLLLERAFLRTLRLERERAGRSLQQLLLMLVDVDELFRLGDGPTTSRRIMGTLFGVVREIDPCGWYKKNSIVGVIFTEIRTVERQSIKEVIESRIWKALRGELNRDQLERIKISFQFFPETHYWKQPGSPLTMYPDLFQQHGRRRLSDIAKRMMDVAGSLAALILLWPAFALIALTIRLTSKGPAVFRQTRIGLYGVPFTFLKFRSMRLQSDPKIHEDYVREFIAGNTNPNSSQEGATAVYKITSDPRVTPFGRFLRRTSLDELPQFWNVLCGEMSLVGPRPPTAYEMECYKLWHLRRVLEVKPGVTGLWQINGRSRTTFDEMVRLDLRYAKTRSLWLDVKILAQTPRAVFSGEGAY